MNKVRAPAAETTSGSRGLPAAFLGGVVLLFGVATSPWVLGRLVSPGDSITRPVYAATGAVAFVAVFVGLMILRRILRLPSGVGRLVFAGAWFGILLVGSVMLDRVLGMVPGPFREGVLFPPMSEVVYDADEFRFTASINQLGFRDREVVPGRIPGRRVVVVGDSFTFGWGVSIDEAWVKRVEASLRRGDPSVEVLNLGAGGAGPSKYVDTVRRAVPLLKPDLVVVSVLEGDDMEQLLEELDRAKNFPPEPGADVLPGRRGGKVMAFVRGRLYPNLTRPRATRESTKETWRGQARTITNRLNDVTRPRFAALSPRVRDALMSGGLNPMWVRMSLAKPDYFQAMARLDSPEVRRGIRELAACLERIRQLAESGGARVLVMAVPHRAYMTPGEQRGMAAVGYAVDASMLESGGAVEAIRRAAREAKVGFFECDEAFRVSARTNVFYYDMDAHFTPAGNARYAELVEAPIQAALGNP